MAETVEIAGRTKKPLWKKLFPLWWFLNDDEEQLPDWYEPTWPKYIRWIFWTFFRNPLQNFRCYVIGVQDCNYKVTGRAPVMCVQRNDLVPPETGWQWSVIWLWVPLPFVSYSGHTIVAYAGWQPSGIFGLKFNLHKE